MSYYLELYNISIDYYQNNLKTSDLLPSRNILKENIENIFKKIKDQKIQNLNELLNQLKDKKKLQNFSKQTGIAEEYLTILVREIKSIQPKPNNFIDFPNVSKNIVSKLEKHGIKNTLQLFDQVLTKKDRKELAIEIGINEIEILRLTKLTDLSRIRWVNHTFAYVLLEANYDTVEKVANADYRKLYDDVKNLNAERKIYKGNIGLHDMKLCVESAKNLSLDIKF
ncbi:MAG: DUF4332 domain-containing protein [Ignavibacteriae bacterium]|nr:DUF4332 domain-containing protein [Ignavibacteriota bacterium]